MVSENLRPSEIVRELLDAVLTELEAEGAGRAALLEQCGAVWMTDSIEMHFKSALSGDIQTVLSPRRESGVRIMYSFEMKREDVAAAEGSISMFAANLTERRAVRLTELSELFGERGGRVLLKKRRSFPEQLGTLGEFTVTDEDTDLNGHMTSHKYIEHIERFLPEKAVPASFIARYISECFPGEVLAVQREIFPERADFRLVRKNGQKCFEISFDFYA